MSKDGDLLEIRLPRQDGVIWKYEIKSSSGDSSEEVRYASLGKKVAVAISVFLYEWHYSFKWEDAFLKPANAVHRIAQDLILNHFDGVQVSSNDPMSAVETFTIEGESGDYDLEIDITFAVNGKTLALAVDSFVKAFNREFEGRDFNSLSGEEVYNMVQKLIAEHFDEIHSIVQLVR